MKRAKLSRKTAAFIMTAVLLAAFYFYAGERQAGVFATIAPAIVTGLVAALASYLGAVVGNAVNKSKNYRPELDQGGGDGK